MNERLVEAMARLFREQLPLAAMARGWMFEEAAETTIAALRAEGFEVYPSEDVKGLISMADRLVFEVGYFDDHKAEECAIVRAAEYTASYIDRLVPVGEGTDDE